MTLIRRDVVIFKDEHVWKLNEQFRVIPGYPRKLRELFPTLPEEIHKIDAAYERPRDGAVILFTGISIYILCIIN